jgi:hypothetical protein
MMSPLRAEFARAISLSAKCHEPTFVLQQISFGRCDGRCAGIAQIWMASGCLLLS